MSLAVNCVDQDDGGRAMGTPDIRGGEESRLCGWLIDRFGTLLADRADSILGEMMASDDAAAVNKRVTEAFTKMNKLDIAELEKAFLCNE